MIAKSDYKVAEISKRVRSAKSPADLRAVSRSISDAQAAERESIDILKRLLNAAAPLRQEQQQTAQGVTLGKELLQAGDGALRQETCVATVDIKIESLAPMSDNDARKHEMETSMAALKIENEALKKENEAVKKENAALQLEKQQAVKNVDDAIEAGASLRQKFQNLVRQYHSMEDDHRALLQECECLRQQLCKVAGDKFEADAHAEISKNYSDSDVSTSASDAGTNEETFPGTPAMLTPRVQIRATSPQILARAQVPALPARINPQICSPQVPSRKSFGPPPVMPGSSPPSVSAPQPSWEAARKTFPRGLSRQISPRLGVR